MPEEAGGIAATGCKRFRTVCRGIARRKDFLDIIFSYSIVTDNKT